jgi:hypothetical protein
MAPLAVIVCFRLSSSWHLFAPKHGVTPRAAGAPSGGADLMETPSSRSAASLAVW